MSVREQFNSIWWTAYDEAIRAGTIEPVAIRHAWATAYLWYFYGYDFPGRPDIISGYRAPFEQAELYRRWQRGDKEGLAGKPARRSWHTIGRAIDVETGVAGFPAYAYLMVQLGMRWGEKFGDRPHFDLPSASQLPPDVTRLL